MKKTLLLAGVASLFAVNTANAEVKPYVGLDYNYSSYGMDKPYNDAFEDDYNSLSFVAGAKLMENFGLEAFYQRSLNEKNTYDGDKYSSRIQNYGVDALGYLPLGCDKEVELIAGLGLGQYQTKYREQGYTSSKEEALGIRANVGAQYNIDENWSVRGMYRHVYLQKSVMNDINRIWLKNTAGNFRQYFFCIHMPAAALPPALFSQIVPQSVPAPAFFPNLF